jgi:hypothetical protein
MSTKQVVDYKDTPREELTAKISKLLKLNYEVLFTDKINTKYNYDDVAKTLVDEKITPSNDFSYTNITKILDEFVYNQREVDELLAKEQAELQKLKTDLENYKTLHRETMTPKKEYEIKDTDFNIIRIERSIPLVISMKRQLVYELYQPDEYSCKPMNYQRMLESLNKIGNPRITAFAEWYANASIREQNTQYAAKYDEYFESLDDLIILHEISRGILVVDGLNRNND